MARQSGRQGHTPVAGSGQVRIAAVALGFQPYGIRMAPVPHLYVQKVGFSGNGYVQGGSGGESGMLVGARPVNFEAVHAMRWARRWRVQPECCHVVMAMLTGKLTLTDRDVDLCDYHCFSIIRQCDLGSFRGGLKRVIWSTVVSWASTGTVQAQTDNELLELRSASNLCVALVTMVR